MAVSTIPEEDSHWVYIQRSALRRRVGDMSHAVNVCVEPTRQMKELRSVIESKWIPVPINVVEKGIDSIADYLWQKGVRG